MDGRFLVTALLFFLLCSSVQSTAISQLRDYSAASGQGGGQAAAYDPSSCANVKIVEAPEGIIRSPFYYKASAPDANASGNIKNNSNNNRTTTAQTSFKCKWTLIGPADRAFEITLVDYERPEAKGSCVDNGRLDIKNLVFNEPNNSAVDGGPASGPGGRQHSLLMPFYDMDVESRMIKKLHSFNKNVLSSCTFPFQPFTVLHSTSNVVQIEYEASSTAAFNFFFTFNVIKPNDGDTAGGGAQNRNDTTTMTTQGDDEEEEAETEAAFCSRPEEIRCEIDYNLAAASGTAQQQQQQQVRHYSCIHKDVLCNCPDASAALSSSGAPQSTNGGGILYDNCDYLMKHFRVYLDFLVQRPADYCHFYLNLNRKCRKNDADGDDGAGAGSRGQAPSSIFDSADADQNLEDYDLADSDTPRDSYPSGGGGVPLVKQAAALSDGLVVDPAANATEAQELCQNVVRSSNFGWISSPGFSPSTFSAAATKYPDNLTCAYHITVQNGSTVQIRFKYYYLNPIFISVPVSLAAAAKTAEQADRRTLAKASLFKRPLNADASDSSKKFQFLTERTIDYDYINIYDGSSANDPLLVHLTASQNDQMTSNLNAKVFNSRSNTMFVVFHSQIATPANQQPARFTSPMLGFNFTWQPRGQCVEDQLSCNSPYEAECYSKAQRCNDVWDCHNGEDERGCGPCPYDQYWCRNHIFCYRQQDRCDGDHQCIDKSDEMNCDSWFCNSANGTFLCKNGRCIYEQWVCDGQADCEDGSDEDKCPSPITRRVITTAVVGGTLCVLLLVMALGCACKLYTLHTVGYRTNARLSQSVQSAAAAAATAPLIPRSSTTMTTLDSNGLPEPTSAAAATSGFLASLLRRTGGSDGHTGSVVDGVPTVHSLPQSAAASLAAAGQQLPPPPPPPPPTTIITGAGELPLPHHLIAPPTYNQTMGLVDEYEQRQLAFIEHVRHILTQQQQQSSGVVVGGASASSTGSTGQPNAATIPLVTTSSTTLHRVTSNTGYRRSHSSRHHRHHHHHHHSSSGGGGGASGSHHHSSSSRTGGQNPDQAPISTTNVGSIGSGGSSSRHSHRHHSQSHSSRQNYDANRRGLTMLNEPAAEAPSHSHSQARRSSNVVATSAMNTSFTSAISSGQTQLDTPLTFNLHANSNNNVIPMIPLVSAESSMVTTNSNSSSTATMPMVAPSSSASLAQQATTFNSLVNKTSNASTNLRDRIAKLIKDIVVHHGDSIQYVQLADQLNNNQPPSAVSPSSATAGTAIASRPTSEDVNGESVSLSSTNSVLSVCLSPEVSVDLTSTPPEIQSDPPSTEDSAAVEATARQSSETPSSSSSTEAAASSSSETKPSRSSSTKKEDDVPLIQA